MVPPSTQFPERFLTLAEMMNISDQELARRKQILEFGPEDEERLQKLADVSVEYAQEVIDAFYRHLLSFEEMKAFFPDSELLNRVKAKQKAYFIRLTQGNYDLDYVEDRLKIGAIHEQIDLPVKFYLSMYNFYLREVWQHIFAVDRDHPDEMMEIFFSLMKLTFLDISLAIDTYIDSRERTIKALQQEAIRELSTPVLPFREGMLLLPIIGQIDSQRARQLTEHLLLSIRANRAKVVVIDITGVATVDSRVANHLVQTVDAARLMGTKVVFSGISPEIALTMVTLGIDLGPVYTVGDLQRGIEHAERLLGYRVEKVAEAGPPREAM
ncbi:MAG: anti-sigma-factor antagonist [uncultured bacterium]|nr:MAG: anti-sigma-factor antagonist [uncultured bacterium]